MAWFFSSPSPLSGPWCSHWVIRVIRTQAFSTKFHKNGFWKRRCGPTPEGLGIQEKNDEKCVVTGLFISHVKDGSSQKTGISPFETTKITL
jgi:hypothetical protein